MHMHARTHTHTHTRTHTHTHHLFPLQADISAMFIVGAVFIVLAFIGVTILEHYGAWDPVWAAIKSAFASAKGIA